MSLGALSCRLRGIVILACNLVVLPSVWGGEPEIDEKNLLTAQKILFESALKDLKLPEENLKFFVCYEESQKNRVKKLVSHLQLAGVPSRSIYWDPVLCSQKTRHGFADKIFKAQKVLVVGSPGLKEQYEKQGTGDVSQIIENLRTRIIKNKKGVEGIIPLWFEGEAKNTFPQGLQNLTNIYLGRKLDYFENFFDLIADIYACHEEPKKAFNQVRVDFKRKATHIPADFLIKYKDKLAQYAQEQKEKDRHFIKSILENAVKENPNARPWQKVIATVPSQNLPDRLKNFQESFPEGSKKSYLTLLWEQLHEESQTTITSVSVSGMGGVGKSTLALQYAYEALDKKAYKYIYWILSDTLRSLIEGYKTICRKLKIPLQADDTDDQIIDYIKDSLPDKENYLLIYDNVPNIDFLEGKTPQSNGHILITSRIQEGWEHPTLLLDLFRPQDSLDYLFKAINVGSQHGIKRTPDNEKKALQVATELGHLPLALSHAAAYISRKRSGNPHYNFNDYYEEFKQKQTTLLQPDPSHPKRRKLADRKGKEPINYEYLVLTTLKMAEDLINDPEQLLLTQQLLNYFAYLDPDAILRDVFLSLVEDEDKLDTAFQDLVSLSLIKNNGLSFSIHRLVQLVLRTEQKHQCIAQIPETLNIILSSFYTYWKDNLKDVKENDNPFQLSQNITAILFHLAKVDEHLGDSFFKNNKDFEDRFITLKIGNILVRNYLEGSRDELRNKIFQQYEQDQKQENQVDEKEKLSVKILQEEVEEGGINLREEDYCLLFSILPKNSSKEGRKEIAKLLLGISPKHRNGFIKLTRPLVEKSMNEAQEVKIINALANIGGPINREVLARSAKDLIESMNGDERAKIIDALAGIGDPTEIDNVTKFAKDLIESMNGDERAKIIDALAGIGDPTEIDNVAKFAKDLVEGMDGNKRAEIIRALACIGDPINREVVVRFTKDLMEGMDGNERAEIIRALACIGDPINREVVVRFTKDLMESMGGYDRAEIIRALANIDDSTKREAIERSIKYLVTQGIRSHDISYIITALNNIKDPTKIEIAARFIKDLVMHGIYGHNIRYIISWVANIDNPTITEVVATLIKDLAKRRMFDSESTEIIEALTDIVERPKREAIARSLKYLVTQVMDRYERAMIINTLADINDPIRIEIVAKSTKYLVAQDMNIYERVKIITALANIKDPTRIEVIARSLKDLATQGIYGHDISYTITVLANIKDPTRIEVVARFIKDLVAQGIYGHDIGYIITALSNIECPPKKEAVARSTKGLIAKGMRGEERAMIIDALSNIEGPPKKEAVAKFIKDLVVQDVNIFERADIYERAEIIRSLANIGGLSKIEAVARSTKDLITEGMRGDERAKVIDALANIDDPTKIAKVARFAKDLITEGMQGDERAKIIDTLGKIDDPTKIAKVARFAKDLITEGMQGDERAKIIDTLGKIDDPTTREAIVRFTEDLITEGMDGYKRAVVITALANIEGPSKIEALIRFTKDLIEGMDGYGRVEIIIALANINDPSKREATAKLTKDLIEGMNGYERAKIITALANINDPSKREATAKLTKDLIEGMNGYERAKIITALANINDPSKREAIAKLTKDLIEGMDGYERAEIITALANINDPSKREAIAKLTKDLIEGMDGYERAEIIDAFGKIIYQDQSDKIWHGLYLLLKDNQATDNTQQWLREIVTSTLKSNSDRFIQILTDLPLLDQSKPLSKEVLSK
jgi:HEAT repeat protein